MQKKLLTIFDSINDGSTDSNIRHIAKMMALGNKDYQDAFLADQLQDNLADEMLAYDHKTEGCNYEVVCNYCGVVESSTFRARKLRSVMDLVSDELGIEEYMDKVVRPVSKELAARVISKIEGPLSSTECDIEVGIA